MIKPLQFLFFYLSCCLSFFDNKANAQTLKATYKFNSFENNDIKSFVSNSILNSIEYRIISNDSIYFLKSKFAEREISNVELSVGGPSEAIFDIKNNLISFNNDKDSNHRFLPIKFTKIDSSVKFGIYTCDLYATSKGDTIYTSKDIPFYVNPFFLDKKSIQNGIVKARIAKIGIFILDNIDNVSNIPYALLPTTIGISIKSNPFFK